MTTHDLALKLSLARIGCFCPTAMKSAEAKGITHSQKLSIRGQIEIAILEAERIGRMKTGSNGDAHPDVLAPAGHLGATESDDMGVKGFTDSPAESTGAEMACLPTGLDSKTVIKMTHPDIY